jgi:hypothetical protein
MHALQNFTLALYLSFVDREGIVSSQFNYEGQVRFWVLWTVSAAAWPAGPGWPRGSLW